ncbi:lysylphosphatidylglycerol synthase transmembrane domain-containing protein [Alisedimentitalea sp. MJ-SS2]|uniref:lysylphosphatidylglycerol synthase transmembrane domain-containing protein n=1 Tax=Aliisedimentitalea sp. MJ-SS2 TaxID=3049795 RepID=UPI0029129B9F|nr:lysylphosphatidylglycerol synthase transmembrane domain-containing protein [Alisedimentitalea sp. MJ-SS2]MDU8926099.1 lysylphosphatidylglycerol synthase transmembrane domain-containing protein [Alisedimentitalea sp. MJ-SS2]
MSSTNQRPLAPRKLRDLALLGGLFVLVIGGLISLAAATGWEETMAQLAKLGALQIAILLVLSLVNYLFRALRWHIFASRLGLSLTLAQNIRHFLGGFAMSVTPGRVGELIRMRWIARETGWAFERTAPLVLIDRASDLAAMGLILGIALSLAAGGVALAAPVAALAIAASIIVTRPALLAGLATQFYRRTGLLPRLMTRIRRAATSLRAFSHPQTLGFAALLGLIGWLAEGYAFHLLLCWFGADIGFWKAVMIFVFSTLAGGLTGAPGGVGGAEAAMVALLYMEGIPPEVAVPATAVIRLTTLWFAILIGLAIFPHAEAKSTQIHQKGAL